MDQCDSVKCLSLHNKNGTQNLQEGNRVIQELWENDQIVRKKIKKMAGVRYNKLNYCTLRGKGFLNGLWWWMSFTEIIVRWHCNDAELINNC